MALELLPSSCCRFLWLAFSFGWITASSVNHTTSKSIAQLCAERAATRLGTDKHAKTLDTSSIVTFSRGLLLSFLLIVECEHNRVLNTEHWVFSTKGERKRFSSSALTCRKNKSLCTWITFQLAFLQFNWKFTFLFVVFFSVVDS